ncbi:MAG: DUF3800 domain-containing protein [archaeon]
MKKIKFIYEEFEPEKYIYFDESGDPEEGLPQKSKPIFFVGCVHSNSHDEIIKVHSNIRKKLNTNLRELHYGDIRSYKRREIAWENLLNSDLKLDVAVSFTNNFSSLKNEFQKMEKEGKSFEFSTGAKYKYFSEMCQTEMYAKLVWLLFAEAPTNEYEGYERQIRYMEQNNMVPQIEYHNSPKNKDKSSDRVNIDIWGKIHLKKQLKELYQKPEETNSEGVQLADILVGGFKDRFQSGFSLKRKNSRYNFTPISIFRHKIKVKKDYIELEQMQRKTVPKTLFKDRYRTPARAV